MKKTEESLVRNIKAQINKDRRARVSIGLMKELQINPGTMCLTYGWLYQRDPNAHKTHWIITRSKP